MPSNDLQPNIIIIGGSTASYFPHPGSEKEYFTHKSLSAQMGRTALHGDPFFRRTRLYRKGNWVIAHIIYPIKWRWFQVLLWRIMKPIVILIVWLFVLNWKNGYKSFHIS
jgi:hypothetical protein